MIYYQDDNLTFEYGEKYGEVFLHCIVRKWSPSILRHSLLVFGKFLNEKEQEGVTRVVTVTPNPKFAKVFGGRFAGNVEHENKTYEVYEWVLK